MTTETEYDDDNPRWTKEDFARAKPIEEVLPPEVIAANFPKMTKRMGRPPSAAPKVPVNLRVDPDVLAAYKADGPGWQTRMHDVLRAAISGRDGH